MQGLGLTSHAHFFSTDDVESRYCTCDVIRCLTYSFLGVIFDQSDVSAHARISGIVYLAPSTTIALTFNLAS